MDDLIPENSRGISECPEVPCARDVDTGRMSPARRVPRWLFALVGVLLTVGIVVAATWSINVPYFALAPGPANDVTDFVEVPEPMAGTGDLFFLTVTLKEVNLIEYLAAMLNGEVDLSARESIRPAGVTSEELRLQNLSLMEQSKRNAVFVALSQLGYDVTFEGTGALVTGVVEGSAADGVLEVHDLIVGVNGVVVEFQTDAVDLIGGFLPGDVISISIDRPVNDLFERLEFDVMLGTFIMIDENGNEINDIDRGMLGVLLGNGPTDIVFPIDVTIDSQNIGGPSAGMMFTLEIMNQLTSEDITQGRRIAGTGTIDQAGRIGPIGGVRQKVFGAIDAGAEYVLVPGENVLEALEAAGGDVKIIQVDTIGDALVFLETLPIG